jgi:hypothetical protein
MKKTYVTPEVEIKRFNTEDIMNNSAMAVAVDGAATTATDATTSIDYNDLFKA